MRANSFQKFLVLLAESFTVELVEHLHDAEQLVFVVEDWRRKNGPGDETRILVSGRVEPRIAIGVADVDALPRHSGRTDDAHAQRYANLRILHPLGNFAEELAL